MGKSCKGPCLETHRGCAEVDFSSSEISPCFQAIKPENIIQAVENAVSLPVVSKPEMRINAALL